MRILAVVPAYPPGSIVGAWCATHLFLRHLAASGHRVRVFTYAARGENYVHEGVQVVTAEPGRAYALNMAMSGGADVVISHAGDRGFGAEVASRAGLPSVRMAHGLLDHAGRADLFVFNSHSLRDSTPHNGPAVVCHPPVDVDWWRVDRPDADAITLVGQSEAKGVETFTELARRLPDRRYVGVRGGYGAQRPPELPNVEVLGPVADMRPVYARTRVLLMPSRIETWGMTAVEAMSAGIPVIAHPTPGLRECLGDAGIFVDRTDVDGWMAELKRLDDPDEYTRASAAASARAQQLHPAASLTRFSEAIQGVVA